MNAALLVTLVSLLLSACLGIKIRGSWRYMGWKRDPSRLDRMPSFGKRTSGLADGVDRDLTADIGSERHEKRVAVLDRMPGTFGKRGGDSGSAENEDISFEDGGAHSGVSGSLGKSSHEAGSVRGREEPSGIAEDKRAPGVLNRMPVTFGKRGLAAVLSDMKNEAERFGEYQEKRLAKLDRMPLTFGKRDNAKDSRIDLGVGDVWEKRLAKLDRMPLTFGKRGGEVDEERDGEDLGDFAADKRQAKLDRMPLNFGKRGDLVDLGKTEESSGSAGGQHLAKLTRTAFVDAAKRLGIRVDGWEKRRAKLDRMPLTFGKRGVSGGRAKLLQSDDSAGIKRLAKLDRMPVTFGKRYIKDEIKRLGKLDRMPLTFGKRYFQDNGEIKRLAKLDRMPLTFGKRGTEENAESKLDMSLKLNTQNDATDSTEQHTLGNIDETKRLAKLDRMPLTFGKRHSTDAESLDKTEDVKRLGKLDRMPVTFGKRFVPPDTENTHIVHELNVEDKRFAKLDRMPLHFGKRKRLSAGGKRQAKLDRMPVTFGKRNYNLRVPFVRLTDVARLDRLPVTFVKRFSGGERILTESGRSESLPESFQSHNILAARTVFRPVQTQEDSQEYLHVDTLLARHLPALLRR